MRLSPLTPLLPNSSSTYVLLVRPRQEALQRLYLLWLYSLWKFWDWRFRFYYVKKLYNARLVEMGLTVLQVVSSRY